MRKNVYRSDKTVISIEVGQEGGRFGVATLGQTVDSGWQMREVRFHASGMGSTNSSHPY